MPLQFLQSSHIKTQIVLYSILALSTAVLIYAAIRANAITYHQSENYDNHLRYHEANALFRQGTDFLTNAVRRYAVTAKPEYMEQYFHESNQGRHRDRALELIADLPLEQSLKDSLNNSMKESKMLMDTEYHAMHLISLGTPDHDILHREVPDIAPLPPEEKKLSRKQRYELAERLLWDDAYIKTKEKIYSHLADGLGDASGDADRIHNQLRRELLHMLTLSAVSLIVMVLTVCGFVFYRRWQRERLIELQADANARMNAKLRDERDRAIKAEKARSYFFSSVSHDIRTPLNSIIGFSEMLQLGIDNPEEKEKALDAIITSGQTLLELINDVLDLSKLESGKMELHPVPTDVAALVGKVATSFDAAVSRSSIQLRTEVGEMPSLRIDPQRIRQILFNLIGNAVKFTEKGSVTVRASYYDGTLTLSVADTGCGISKENIGKLMSPYVQLQEHDSTKGTGLGLAICKQLSKQMNGTLDIQSTEGKGSTFTLRIPNVEALSERASEAYFSEQKPPEETAPLEEVITEKRFLVVDDQKLNRRILQTMLSRLGINKVATAGDGKEALEVMRSSGDIDVVLTDMSMPVMDGAGLVREIRKSPDLAKLPVYVITADVEIQGGYRKFGFDDLLIKPITLEKLRDFLVRHYSEWPA